jgi:hypothetical protein
MSESTRILTTRVGSLPRPQEVVIDDISTPFAPQIHR